MQPGARRISGKRGVSKSLPSEGTLRQTCPPAPALEGRRPAALAALEQRDAAERQALLRHAPREAAPERPARAWDNSEIVIHLHLDN